MFVLPEDPPPPTEKAARLADMARVLSPEALVPSQLEHFYFKTDSARDPRRDTQRALNQAIRASARSKVLFIGHRGCGKSTEIVRYKSDHPKDWTFVEVSVLKEGLIVPNVPDLLVLICDRLVSLAAELDLHLNEQIVEGVHVWFSKTLNVDTSQTDTFGSLTTEAQATTPAYLLPFLKLTGILKAEVKAGTSRVSSVTTEHPHRLSELTGRVARLVTEFSIAAHRAKKPEPLIIIEDLDKVGFAPVHDVFLRNPVPLAELPCRALFTPPVGLHACAAAAGLATYFTSLRLPMIRVLDQKARPHPDGICVVRNLVRQRLADHLIGDDDLDYVAEMTGGILRMTFSVLAEAASSAEMMDGRPTADRDRLVRADVDYALGKARAEMKRRISTRGFDPAFIAANSIDADALVQRLVEVHEHGSLSDETRPVDEVLLEAQALIEYNGEDYRCVHPLLREMVASKGDVSRTTP